ncbi:MAG TPA: ankyrin repeat domain-containing protein [Vicinamibacterales bacterium]|nr:ankyrin repeat domain-containing protein [Vicinamibacterales bacterium]
MQWRTLGALVILGFGLASSAIAASSSPLADAAEKRDQAAVRTLLKSGSGVNAPQPDGTTALHWAAYHDDTDTAALLLKAGADVNAVNRYGMSSLAQASRNGSATMVKMLLDAGADINLTLKGGETVLMLASRSGSAEVVQMLLARHANPNARERLGQTALMWAAAEGHTAVVRALMAAGADRNAKTESGFTPFFFAVREGRLETVRAFLAAGADANAMMQRPQDEAGPRPATGGRTSPLLLAVQNAHFELAIALIDAGADPNDRRTGFTPLHLLPGVRKPDSSDGSDGAAPVGAGRLSSLEFVREIVKRGANVNSRLPQGSPRMPATSSQLATSGATPLLFAADRSDVPLMRLLLELGADPLLPNANNTTPLMAAAGVGTREVLEEAGEENEALEAVEMLLDRGADVNGVDNNGDTAMHGAAANNYPRVVNLLASRGADPMIWSRPNKTGRTPLYIAEGYVGVELRPDPPTIAAVTRLMLAAGLSLEGKRPAIVDQYRVIPAPPKAAEPAK